MFDDICKNITWLLIYDQTKNAVFRCLDYDISFGRHTFSLFHVFSDESLSNHSYVTSTDVQSLNHMHMKYVKHHWITNATADHVASRTLI